MGLAHLSCNRFIACEDLSLLCATVLNFFTFQSSQTTNKTQKLGKWESFNCFHSLREH